MGKVYYYEGSKILAPYTIISNEPHFDMTTISLKTQRTTQGHQRWELSFDIITTADNEVDSLLGTLLDFDTSRTFIMPQLPSVANLNTITPTPTLAASATAGSSTVYIDSITSDGFLPKGSFIKFSNHDKVYITTNDLDLSGTTLKQLDIYPSLVSAVTASVSLQSGDLCLLKYYISIDNQMGITFQDGVLSTPGTINLVEAV